MFNKSTFKEDTVYRPPTGRCGTAAFRSKTMQRLYVRMHAGACAYVFARGQPFFSKCAVAAYSRKVFKHGCVACGHRY